MSTHNFEDILFKECIEALDDKVAILSKQESDQKWVLFKKNIPLLFWGRIDWDKIEKKNIINAPAKIITSLEGLFDHACTMDVYVFWNDASLPVIKANLYQLIVFFDDVTCVAPDTWFLNLENRYIIENFHDGELTIGTF